MLQEAAELVEQTQKAYEAEKAASLEELASTVAEPRVLWEKAIAIVTQYTSAKNAYVATVVDAEEPDWVPPEDMENPDVETDDEADGPKAAEGEGGDAPPAEEAPAEGGEGGEAAAPKPKIPRKADYSKKLLSYVAANASQAFVVNTDLARPPPPPEDADPDNPVPVEQPAVTFRILDEQVPMIEVPNVSAESRVKFFKGLPKVRRAALPNEPLNTSRAITAPHFVVACLLQHSRAACNCSASLLAPAVCNQHAHPATQGRH